MKSINFIDPVPPHKQKALIIWLYTTAGAMIIFFMVAFYVHLHYLRMSHGLSQDVRDLKLHAVQLETTKQKKVTLEQTKKTLEQRLHKLRTINENSHAPYSLLLMLATLTPHEVCLTACVAQPGKTVRLEGLAYTTKAVTVFMEALQNCQAFKEVNLMGLTTTPNPEGHPTIQFAIENSWAGSSHEIPEAHDTPNHL
jgi:Tfp pilus assembly protein PilN